MKRIIILVPPESQISVRCALRLGISEIFANCRFPIGHNVTFQYFCFFPSLPHINSTSTPRVPNFQSVSLYSEPFLDMTVFDFVIVYNIKNSITLAKIKISKKPQPPFLETSIRNL